MAEEGRGLLIHGLPTDADHERLRDKLLIHFLRVRNGGGEVTSITVIGGSPTCALITFEESRVALSALHHHPHIIELDGRKYELSLSLPSHRPLNLNKMVIDMSVTIDCSQLQQVEESLNILRRKFPGLHMNTGLLQQTCTLQGLYSDVQDALSYMQKYFSPNQTPSQTKYSNHSEIPPEKKECLGGQEQKRWTSSANQSPAFYMGDPLIESTLGTGQQGYRHNRTKVEKTKMEEGAECKVDETDWQDFSLIMEADVFAYLQNNKEYKRILHDHGVKVVHVTSDGVTTMYLESEEPTGRKKMQQAQEELRQLYQQQENCLRKDQLPKCNLHLPNGITSELKSLQSVLPNVLLSYDRDNIYIVGEKSEVSQAKQILLVGTGDSLVARKKELPASSSSFTSPSPEPFQKEEVKKKNEAHTLLIPKLIGSNTERKREGGREYNLAARFKSSGLGGRGFYAKEETVGDLKGVTNKLELLTLTKSSQSTPPIRPSLSTAGLFSHEVTGEERKTRLNCTEDDVLFKTQDMPSLNTSGSKTSTGKSPSSLAYTSTLTTGVNAMLNSSVNALLDSNTEDMTATSKSPLRRANSFSGQLGLKEQKNPAGSMSNTSYPRARSNSHSGGKAITGLPAPTVEAEFTVCSVMWNYIKDAYQNQVDTIKSDMEMSEKQVGKTEVSVILKGVESSKVEESHRQLQNLVATVASDFTCGEFSLAELGLVEKDEVFEACCSDVQSRFRTVILHTLMDRVFMLGPKLLCSQVIDTFRDVFGVKESYTIGKTLHMQVGATQGITKEPLSTPLEKSQGSKVDFKSDQNKTVPTHSDQIKYKSTSHSTKPKSSSMDRSEKHKYKKDEFRKKNSHSQSNDAIEDETAQRSDEQTSLSLRAHKEEDIHLKQTKLLFSKPSEHCTCGASGLDVKRTSCGVIVCGVCIRMHSLCRVCGSEESRSLKKSQIQGRNSLDVQHNQTQEQHSGKESSKIQKGIQGTMTYSETSLCLHGFERFMTAKITYRIPDGIQGDTDPCPGASFQGGIFEAYLPLNPKGRALLRCLERAFQRGLTFAISPGDTTGERAKVIWGKIPHKTKMEGGKRNGYPDSTYLNNLCGLLLANGIEGVPPISQDQVKSS